MILRDIITEEEQRELEESFALTTGFGVVFTDADGKHIGPGGNFCRFCSKINEMPSGHDSCTQTNKQAIELALKTQKPSIYICHAGLVNIEIPLIYENCCLGALTAGQVLCTDPDYYPRDDVQGDAGHWLASPELASYYKEIIVLTPEKIQATAVAMEKLSTYIIQKAAYGQMQESLKKKTEQLLLANQQLKLAKLDALQKQVMPHFIFNVLNSVSRLISLGEYNTAQSMLTSFTGMMRYSLSNVRANAFLGQELEYIKNYLSIQQFRFGDRISYRIDCDDGVKNLIIPFFSIQPLVENAVLHGLKDTEKGGLVEVSCRKKGCCCEIVVSDNGNGIPADVLQKIRADFGKEITDNEHIGLKNTYNRFLYMYENAFSYEIKSGRAEGTVITIRIDMRPEKHAVRSVIPGRTGQN